MEYEKKLESALSEKSDDITDKEKRITELEARLESIENEKTACRCKCSQRA